MASEFRREKRVMFRYGELCQLQIRHPATLPEFQCERQPYLMNVPRNTPTDAISSQGDPCIIRTTPQLMKKANNRNTRMAATNFIAADCSFSGWGRNPGSRVANVLRTLHHAVMKWFSVLLLCLCPAAFAGSIRFYVGTYTNQLSQGIYTGWLDTDSGQVSSVELAAQAANPNFLALAPGGQTLYAVTADEGGSVTAFRVLTKGLLQRLNSLPSGKGGCHVTVDATGRNVLVANYSAGSLTGFRSGLDGSLEKRAITLPFSGSGPDLKRQDKPHLHAAYFSRDNRQLYACDLGTDAIWQFHLEAANGVLEPMEPAAARVPPGSGPRHLAFSPDERFAFVNGEMGLNVTAFARDPVSGELKSRQTVSWVAPDAPTNGLTAAEIVCHPNGKWLYVSVRDVAGQGRDEIAVFTVGLEGGLKCIQNFPAGVKVPRGFDIDPTGRWLIVGGQGDNKITVHQIDAVTGQLSATDQTATIGAPVCVIFAPPPQ